ncbi:MAG TPA: hypothetical protein VD970_01550, partial [Acetobacteraceae bacterium]|nr:hypothetical protein [Acetobacteraceae bacterium]
IENGTVILRHYLTGREERIPDCAALLWTGAQRARNALYAALRAAGQDRSWIIGDAFAPRRVSMALVEAQTAARAI